MILTLCWHSDVDSDIEHAMASDKAEEAARLSQSLEHMIRIMESWVLRSGGRMLADSGTVGSAEVEAEYLDELPDVVEQAEGAANARMHVGVGAEPSEALVAMRAAQKRGGDPAIVLYTPDLHDDEELAHGVEFSEGDMDELEEGGPNEQAQDPDEPFLGKAQFGGTPREPGEASQIAAGQLSPTAAAPSPPPSASFSPQQQQGAPQEQQGARQEQQGARQEQQGARQEQQAGAPASDDQLLQAIGGVLQDFQSQLPFFEQQVRQANPQAYEAVMGIVQAMIAMAQQLAGGGPEGSPPPEAGGPAPSPVAKAEVDVPTGHKVGMKVPEGGSSCANCKFLKNDGKSCGEKHWVEWHNGDPILPQSADEYCCDMYKPQGELEKVVATDPEFSSTKVELEPHEAPPDSAKLRKLHGAAEEGDKTEREPHRAPPLSMDERDEVRRVYDAFKSELDKLELGTEGKLGAADMNWDQFLRGFEHERREHPHLSHQDVALATAQHLKEDSHYYSKLKALEWEGMLGKLEVPSSKRHYLQLPAGSVHHKKVKVIEPVTGKVSWHQVGMGQKMSGDGHTLSPFVNECPSADTPDKRAADAGLIPPTTE